VSPDVLVPAIKVCRPCLQASYTFESHQPQFVWWATLLILIGTSCVKVSVLLFYRRLVKDISNKIMIYTIWSSIAFVVLFTLIFIILLLVQCSPIDSFWLSLNPLYTRPHRCISNHASIVTTFLANSLYVFTDIITVTLPAVVVMRLNLEYRVRAALLVIFGVGYL
jgi:hypothetical protein